MAKDIAKQYIRQHCRLDLNAPVGGAPSGPEFGPKSPEMDPKRVDQARLAAKSAQKTRDNVLYHGTVGIPTGRGPPRAAAILALAAAIALAAAAVLPYDILPDAWTLHDAVSSFILAGHAFAQVLSNLVLVPVGSLEDTTSLELNNPRGIAIFEHGGANYAAVAAYEDDGIQIIDLTDPASPSAAGRLGDTGSRELDGATGIAIFTHNGANYAAVASIVDDGVQIVNLTDPASPSAAGRLQDGGTILLDNPYGIAIFEHDGANYAAVTARSLDNAIQIINLTDPASPSAAGRLQGGSTVHLGTPTGIAIFKHGGANYAAVSSSSTNAVQIVNLTNPASPSGAGFLQDGGTILLDNPRGIAIFEQGSINYAAVATYGDDGVQIVNLANPASPSAAGSLGDEGSLELDGAHGIAIFGYNGANYAAVASERDNGVQIVNLTNPASPSAAGHLSDTTSRLLDGAESIAIFEHGGANYAAVAADDDDGVQILRIDEPASDATAPTITVTGANPATVAAGRTYTDAGATCEDDIDGTLSVTTTGTVDTSTPGTYTITYTCTDAANNTATATRTVNVGDVTPPAITVSGANPATVLAGRTYTDLGATCRDNIDGTLRVTTTGTVDTSTPGTYTITYTCTDAANNTATATRTVNVRDTTAPTITVSGANPATVDVGRTYDDAGATCTDNKDGTLRVTATGTVDTSTHGTYTITYTCTDTDGNTATATRTVNVGDVTPPAITVTGDNPAGVLAGRTYDDAGATCMDNVDGTLSVTATGTVDTSTPGTYTVTYTCTDTAGNTATAYRTVIVGSNTPPTLTIWNHRPSVGADNHPSYASDAICTDAEDGNISNLVTTSVSVQANDRATITYSCTDRDGNTVKKIRQVPVTDTEPPTVVVTGQPVVEIIAGEPYTDAGATCTDDRPEATVMTTFSTVDTTTPGTYTVFYECTDKAGNKASGVRTVHVRPAQVEPGKDTDLHPVLTVPGPVTLTVKDAFEAPSATCTDHEDDDMDLRIDVDASSVNTEQVGRYTVFYTCTDSAGNLATGSLYVNVNPAP